MWFGVMFALCTGVIAVALVFVLLAVLTGLVMPSKTVRGQLRSLAVNTKATIAQVESLTPR